MRQVTDYELECLIAETEQAGLLQAPGRMKGEIMEKSKTIQTQAARQVTRASVRMELLLYGLKTAAAVATAILLFGVISHPTLQSAIEQNEVWTQENTFSDTFERVNKKLWQGTGENRFRQYDNEK